VSTDENITKPTIETVLERINSLGEKFDTRMSGLGDRMSALEREMGEIRNEVRTGLKMVERKIDLLNKNILQVSADQKELEERVENLETKAS
jgi:predicted RNase H-like nuclease (RuvC/YqgF family)